MDKNMVFFGENGLTSTSANHVANLAKEFAQNYEGKLSDFNFYSTNIGLIGNSDSSRTSVGLTPAQLQEIPDILEKVAQANSLISWLREAIKARESELETIRKKDISEWCEENGIKYWESPSRPDTYTRDEAIASLNIKERNRIYELQAKCSVIGKFIHPDGRYSNARKRLLKVLGAPYDVRGEGRDALVYSYKPTCEEHDVNEMFFKLQLDHRATQAQLNSILHEIDEAVRAENLRRENEYAEKLHETDVESRDTRSKFEVWKTTESKKIADLKIIIPDHLKGIYDLVNMLGK